MTNDEALDIARELDYDPITCYVEDVYTGVDRTRFYFIGKAPDSALIDLETLSGPELRTRISLMAANGEVVYEIVGVGDRGRTLCRKVEDNLTPYTPPGEKKQ